MKRVLVLFALVAIAPLAHVAAQTTQTTQKLQTAPRTTLGAKLVTRSNAVTSSVTGAASQFTQVDFDWGYTANAPVCGTSLTNCLAGFTLTNTTLGTVVATPTTLGPTALSYAYIPAGGVPFGTLAFSLVANGYDGSGNPLTSVPATVSVVVNVTTLNGPTNLTGKVQ
jgi:hypothetical protein